MELDDRGLKRGEEVGEDRADAGEGIFGAVVGDMNVEVLEVWDVDGLVVRAAVAEVVGECEMKGSDRLEDDEGEEGSQSTAAAARHMFWVILGGGGSGKSIKVGRMIESG
jgi:hypothetical protein